MGTWGAPDSPPDRAGEGPLRASRLRRPSWRDPRLLTGLALVLGSVVLGTTVVTAADDTVAVYAAPDTLVPGDPVDEDALDVVRVGADGPVDLYLAAGEPLPGGAVVTRAVGPGELVPVTAVGSAEAMSRRPVAVPLGGPLPDGIVPGARVDVWIAASDGGGDGGTARPAKELADVEVAAVDVEDSGLGPTEIAAVDLLLDDDAIASVLGALANGHRVDVVLVPGTTPRRP